MVDPDSRYMGLIDCSSERIEWHPASDPNRVGVRDS